MHGENLVIRRRTDIHVQGEKTEGQSRQLISFYPDAPQQDEMNLNY